MQAMLLFEVNRLNNPGEHSLHTGCVVLVPLTIVYLPFGHLVCAAHLLAEGEDLKNPILHSSHVSVFFACIPAGHSTVLAFEF